MPTPSVPFVFRPNRNAWAPSAAVLAAGNAARVRYQGGRRYCDVHTSQVHVGEGTQRLRNAIVARWPVIRQTWMPGRSRTMTGCQGLDVHQDGRGIDFMATGGADLTPVAEYLVTHADELGVQEVIWRETCWVASSGRRWHAWPGGSAWGHSSHRDHVHCSLTLAGAGVQNASAPARSIPTPAGVEDGQSADVDMKPPTWGPTALQAALGAGIAVATGVGAYFLFRKLRRR